MLSFFTFALTALAAAGLGGATYLNSSAEYLRGALGPSPHQTFVSSNSKPVLFNFLKYPAQTPEPGLLFIAPRGSQVDVPGPHIFTWDGDLVWDGSAFGQAMQFKPSTYQGKSVIALWQGQFSAEWGNGYGLVLDEHYEVIAKVTANVDGAQIDFHEFTIHNDHALVTIYATKRYGSGYIIDGVAQDIDIKTGEVVWTWRSLDHIDPSQCYVPPGQTGRSPNQPWDYFHINSVAKDSKGNYLISSRHCSAIYYVSGNDGSIIWQIGGKRSSFAVPTDAVFHFQHDARWHDNETTISLFDNAAAGAQVSGQQARGLLLRPNGNQVDLVTVMPPPLRFISPSQGSMQRQASGNWLLGWGALAIISETSPDGDQLWSAMFGAGQVTSYQAHRARWVGRPKSAPSLAVRGSGNGAYEVFVSWNGDTEVRTWEVYGIRGQNAPLLATFTRTGFETRYRVANPGVKTIFIRGLDGNGQVLGHSSFRNLDGSDGGLVDFSKIQLERKFSAN